MIKEIQLYEYQKDMLRQIEDAFVTHQSVMVQMPTGTGKTVLISEVVKREERRVKNPCVWIVVHRRELVEQIKETLERRLGTSLDAEREKSNVIEVFSIQWLSRHYQELEERPTLIVIDEAHHALAKTYAEMMNAYPEAKKLGVTATPCRLNKRGFTDLFEVLLTSHSISNFIKDGYLSDFDYVSLNPSSEDQKKIDRMSKRATDGDYSIAEMQDVLDCKPSIGRLYQTIKEFAAGKKGIVYAINIEHAEHIAAYYREQGIEAVAISSKTPLAERKSIIEKFKGTSIDSKPNCASLSLSMPMERKNDADNKLLSTENCGQTDKTGTATEQMGNIQVLVNVDLFGEGFDCPDVEFIQLARPTLSLAKYLQMVGRGLRVAKSKECCIILDNVGLYRLFGLPTTEWNWAAMFLGNQSGMGEVNMAKDFALKTIGACYSGQKRERMDMDNDTMVVIARHDVPRVQAQMQELTDMYRTIRNLRKTECGYIGDGVYIRTIEKQGIYKTTNDIRLGWRMVYRTVDGVTRYYALHERSERMEYVGRRNPWSERATGIIKQYFYPCENNDNQLTEIPVEEPTYITG